MVSNTIHSRFRDLPPSLSQDRKIKGGPLYATEDLLTLLAEQGSAGVIAWTRNARAELQRLNLDDEALLELIRAAITEGKYHGSEWCEQSPGGAWSACDAYQFMYREWFPAADKHIFCEYYLKLALGKSGVHLLLISCHPS
jgi:hypothetical protein